MAGTAPGRGRSELSLEKNSAGERMRTKSPAALGVNPAAGQAQKLADRYPVTKAGSAWRPVQERAPMRGGAERASRHAAAVRPAAQLLRGT